MTTTEPATISSPALLARLDIGRPLLDRWVHQKVLHPTGGNGSGRQRRWDPPAQTAAAAVCKAWKTGITDIRTLRHIATVVHAGPGHYNLPNLTVIVDPDTVADLDLPFDRHTLIVETRTPPDEKRP